MLRLNQTIFLFLALLLGCQSRDVRPKITGAEYFPLKVGTFWIYDVSQTTITQLGGQSTSTFELKTEITDSIVSGGEINYVLQRFKRVNSSQPWTAIETWSARKNQFQGILQKGNTIFLELAFPFSEGKSWNGNTFNSLGGSDLCPDGTLKCENYLLSDWMKRFETTGVSFEDSVTIIENNDNDPVVKQDVRKSVYAKSVGLVYHEETILEYCTVGDCINKQIVENGNVIKQTIKDYGGL